jgi:UDP-glucose 4-epimerase
MKSLVTGGAGFIGSHVVDALLDMGHEVVVLDDLSGGFAENVNSKAHLFVGSITDAIIVDHLFGAVAFDYVYHLAAYAAEGLSHFIRRFNYVNNLVGSVNIINACVRHRVKCLVFTSSIAVYGTGRLPMTENLVPQPEDPYGIAKYAVEMDLAAAHRQFGLHYIIFRPHNVYGERQNIGDPYRNVVGIFMNQLLRGAPLTIFGDGNQTRAFTYIYDVAPAIAQSVENPLAYEQVFNIGAGHPCTVNELARRVQDAMGTQSDVVHLPERHEVKHAFSDHTKVGAILGAPAVIPLADGLARMAEWVKAQGARAGQPFENIEIPEGLPQSWEALTR